MKPKNHNRLICSIIIVFFLLVSLLLYFFNNLGSLLYYPLTNPEQWCDNIPCIQVNIFFFDFILAKPTSTIFVYLLGVIAIFIGVYLLKSGKGVKFASWWGYALILWGLGAIFAGTSYQAFSYELKCAGRPYCLWTSWWEIMYLMFSVGSVDAMMLAQANLSSDGKLSKYLKIYGMIHFITYIFTVSIGSLAAIQFLISFELLVLFLVPNILIFILLNFNRYKELKLKIDQRLLLIWIFLILIMAAYFLYLVLGITEILWAQGVWFSENDVLHIGLILWMVYIGFSITRFNLN